MNAVLATLYPNSLFTWHVSINLGSDDSDAIPLSTALLQMIFMTILHEGVLKMSKRFDVLHGDFKAVLGCLQYVLEKTANMSPNLTPERNGGQKSGVNETADADDG